MSSEIQFDYLANKNCYALVRNATGSIWNGAAFAAYATVNYASYPLTATEQGTASGYYTASFPSVAAGVYYVVSKEKIGGSPAETDITIGTGIVQWDGSAVLPLSGVPTSSFQTNIAQAIFRRDVANDEVAAPVHSLAVAILKLVSRFNAKTGSTYQTDGVTVKMVQAVTTDPTMVPIKQLDVGT